VHQPSIAAQSEHGECLHCTHERTARADWDVFVRKMDEHFGIQIPDKHMPNKFARDKEPLGEPSDTTVDVATPKPTLPRSKRKRPLRTLSLSPDGWGRLDEIARRWGLSRSGAVERLVREATMPRDLRQLEWEKP
jgi:hypothetical protein